MTGQRARPAQERLADDPTSELWGEHLSRYRFACQGAAGLRVLDVACGAGFGLRRLRQAGARAFGFDLDLSALRASRDTQAVPVAAADAGRLPLADDSIDLAVSFETLEHVPDAEVMVAELRRVIRPAGRLILSTPNRAFGPPELHTRNPFHVREFTGHELQALLARHFEQVVVHGQWPEPSYRYVPFRMVAPDRSARAMLWKLQNRLPVAAREALARAVSGGPFYPGETDYRFLPEAWAGAHGLLAVAARPRARS